MATKSTTSKKVATVASKTLKDPKATKEAKSVAASALANAPDKKPAKKKEAPVENPFTPGWYMCGEQLVKVESVEPFKAEMHSVTNGVIATNEWIGAATLLRPATDEEVTAVIYA